MGRVIIPNRYVQDIEEPIIFLAGPIRSAPNWQDEAAVHLLSQRPDLVVVSPRRGVREKISSYIATGKQAFESQRAWEWHYLEIASKTGAILFWLPEEEKHDCEKVYGAMTRIELGQWMTRYMVDNSVRWCVGSDWEFPEIHTIDFDIRRHAPDKMVFPTLEETCAEALRLARL